MYVVLTELTTVVVSSRAKKRYWIHSRTPRSKCQKLAKNHPHKIPSIGDTNNVVHVEPHSHPSQELIIHAHTTKKLKMELLKLILFLVPFAVAQEHGSPEVSVWCMIRFGSSEGNWSSL